MIGEFPAQMASNAEMFPFDDVIMMSASMIMSVSVSFCIRFRGRIFAMKPTSPRNLGHCADS